MNIFADFHHFSLWKSFEYLFEKRLGHQLFRPIGMDWYPTWWKIADPYEMPGRTATQYLDTVGHTPDHPEEDGILYYDHMKGITLKKFKDMPLDIIIATIPEHIEIYQKLLKAFLI